MPKLIFDRYAWSLNRSDGSDGVSAVRVDHSDLISKHGVGQLFCVSMGAPGTGSIQYMIDRIDESGIWGMR